MSCHYESLTEYCRENSTHTMFGVRPHINCHLFCMNCANEIEKKRCVDKCTKYTLCYSKVGDSMRISQSILLLHTVM